MSITKTEFESYVEVQESGATNMFDIVKVGYLSSLETKKVKEIMKNYSQLKKKYGGK